MPIKWRTLLRGTSKERQKPRPFCVRPSDGRMPDLTCPRGFEEAHRATASGVRAFVLAGIVLDSDAFGFVFAAQAS